LPDYTFYFLACGILFLIGLVLLAQAIPYLQNNIHKDIPPIVQSHNFEKIPTWLRLEIKTKDALMANNEVSIQARTLNSINMNEIRRIDLIFIGAEKSTNTPPVSIPQSPPSNASIEELNQYRTDMSKYTEYIRELSEATASNILMLNSERNYTDEKARISEIQERLNHSIETPLISTFSGELSNITYSSGGTFDIGVTLYLGNGGVIGYGMSDMSYVIKDAITVSPAEVKLQVENNNIMVGLGWLGASLVFFALFGGGLLELIKKLTFGA